MHVLIIIVGGVFKMVDYVWSRLSFENCKHRMRRVKSALLYFLATLLVFLLIFHIDGVIR